MKRDFVLSGALHALVLTGLLLWGAGWIETPRMPEAITVALIELVGAPKPDPRSTAPAPDRSPAEPAAVHAPAETMHDPPARRARPVTAIATRTLRAPERGVTALQAATSGGPGAPKAGGGAQAAGPDVDRRMAIIRSRIQDALVYPREARRRGIEGMAEVRFDLKEDGRLRSVELASSSGRGLLDDASIETVRRAQPFPYVEGALQVPVVFRLTGD